MQGAHATLRTEYAEKDLVYLNVQRACDGARLCETAASPAGALATPVLGQCLAVVVSAVDDDRIDCVRNPSTGAISAS